MSGKVRYRVPGGAGELYFRYKVVRVWNKSAEEVLAGDLATLPLAPLADVPLGRMPSVIHRMQERIEREAGPEEAGTLWTTTMLLLGLRFKRDTVIGLLKGVGGLKESDTYMMILEEGEARGEARGERKLLLRQGEKRFGSPDAQVLAILESIDSPERLEQLGLRLLEVESWKELLA
jgi:predicted transposase YdaD